MSHPIFDCRCSEIKCRHWPQTSLEKYMSKLPPLVSRNSPQPFHNFATWFLLYAFLRVTEHAHRRKVLVHLGCCFRKMASYHVHGGGNIVKELYGSKIMQIKKNSIGRLLGIFAEAQRDRRTPGKPIVDKDLVPPAH